MNSSDFDARRTDAVSVYPPTVHVCLSTHIPTVLCCTLVQNPPTCLLVHPTNTPPIYCIYSTPFPIGGFLHFVSCMCPVYCTVQYASVKAEVPHFISADPAILSALLYLVDAALCDTVLYSAVRANHYCAVIWCTVSACAAGLVQQTRQRRGMYPALAAGAVQERIRWR